jgi:hypothetical protein
VPLEFIKSRGYGFFFGDDIAVIVADEKSASDFWVIRIGNTKEFPFIVEGVIDPLSTGSLHSNDGFDF